MRSVAALLILLLCACASDQTRSASRPVAEQQVPESPSFWSGVGTVVTYTGVGAALGLGVGLAATAGNSCEGDACLVLLGFGVALAPVGAVIGAGAGIYEVVQQHRRAKKAAAAALAPEPCPDERTQDWLRTCQTSQGRVPAAAAASSFNGWFAQCEAALDREFEAVRAAELPAECLAHSVPKWMELDCKRTVSLIEQRHDGAVRFLQSERKRREGSPEFAHCGA
jgi:hypothetical protein